MAVYITYIYVHKVFGIRYYRVRECVLCTLYVIYNVESMPKAVITCLLELKGFYLELASAASAERTRGGEPK